MNGSMMGKSLDDIAVCVFDAYGTLVDFESGIRHVRDKLGDKADALSRLWRDKQLQYTHRNVVEGRSHH